MIITIQKNSEVMNDYEVMAVLSYLNIRERFRLSTVSKQFNECVERLNKSQKMLTIKLIHYDPLDFINIVINENIIYRRTIADTSIKELVKSGKMFDKFKNVEKIEFKLNTINENVFEWINGLFPDLKSISIKIKASEWTTTQLKAIKSSFGSKWESIRIKSYIEYESLESAGILQISTLRSITTSVIPNEEYLRQFLSQLQPTIYFLSINILFDFKNFEVLNDFRKTNQIKKLKFSFSNDFSNGNYLLEFFLQKFNTSQRPLS